MGVSALRKRDKTPFVSDNYTMETLSNEVHYYVDDTGNKTALTYYKSQEISNGSMLRFYVDSNNHQYGYDESGELIAFEPAKHGTDKTFAREGKKTDKEINTLAIEYIKQIYGKAYAKKLSHSDTVYSEGINTFDVYFEIVCFDTFVTESCVITMQADGSLLDVCTFAKNRTAKLDLAKLEQLEADTLKNVTEKQLQAKYETKLTNYLIGDKINVVANKDEYWLSVPTEITLGKGETTYSQRIDANFDLQGKFLNFEIVK